ncbi:MAG TPA: hypothetical protein VLH09_06445 [Bryobacteraceae bacterium]|nr:hypothetical protein [Bryobacteraceae bacterium]
MIVSTPVRQKPDLAQYPLSTLRLFGELTRGEYEAKYGEQPPPFDPNKPPKLWFDTSENAGNYTRYTIGSDQKVSFLAYTMTKELAASVNLPGAYRYAAYAVAPTGAIVVLVSSDGSTVAQLPVPAVQLATLEQATGLASSLGGTLAGDSSWFATSVQWGMETRRMYNIVVNGKTYNAGVLLQQQNANGIGAPGEWVEDAGGLRWAPGKQITAPLDPAVQAVPVPCRTLHADEEIAAGFGNVPVIRKIAAAGTPATTGEEKLEEAIRLIKLFLTRFGIAY